MNTEVEDRGRASAGAFPEPQADIAEVYRRRHRSLVGAGTFVRFIAEGGMGALVAVEGVTGFESEKTLALKFLRNDRLSNGDFAGRFRREIELHAAVSRELQLPRLLRCFAIHLPDPFDPATIYTLLKYCPGGTLAQMIERPSCDIAASLRIVADGLEGLQALHGHSYLYRDFHPSNLFIELEAGTPRGILGDLGTTTRLTSDGIFSTTIVESGRREAAGKPGFIDPWWTGRKEVDQYAVGATIYSIVAGVAPAVPASRHHLSLPAHCRHDVGRAFREAVDEVLRKLTNPDLEHRYATVSFAREDVVRLIDIAAADRSGRGSHPAGMRIGRHNTPGGRLPVWRRRAFRGLAAFALVGVLAALGYFLANRKPTSPPGNPTPNAQVRSTRPAVPPSLEQRSSPEPVPETTRRTPDTASAPRPSADTAVPTGRTTRELKALLNDARRSIATRRDADARATLEDAAKTNPRDADVIALLALVMSRSYPASLPELVPAMRGALAASPERGDLRLALARVLAQNGSTLAARSVLQDAPSNSSDIEQIRMLLVTLDARRDR